MEQELKVVSFLHCVASWHLNPDLSARAVSSFVLVSKPCDYDEGPVSVPLCLHFPGLWWPFALPPLLSRSAAGGEVWLSPTVCARGPQGITKHFVLRHLNGSRGRTEILTLIA